MNPLRWAGNVWSAVRGRGPDVKASASAPTVVAPGLSTLWDGRGVWRVPDGSRFNWVREAGDLRMNSVVAVCRRWLRDQFLQAELKVGYRDDGGEYRAADDHPLPYLLTRRPNPYQTARHWWSGVLGDYTVYGNLYAPLGRLGGGRGLMAEIYWAAAKHVQVHTTGDTTRPIDYYRYYNGRGWEDWAPEDLAHVLDDPDPDNPILGLGRVRSMVRNAAALNAGENWNASTLKNGHGGTLLTPREGRLPLATLEAEAGPDESARNAALRRLKRELTGDGAGGVDVALLAMEAQRIGFSPEEMRVESILDRPESLILAAMGLNAMALDLPSSRDMKTYANKGEARREAWEHGVIPLQDDLADQLGTRLLPEFGDWKIDGKRIDAAELVLYWDRDDVPALREDMDARSDRASTLFTSTLYPRNRALTESGLEPLEEGDPDGDLYFGEPTASMEARQIEQDYFNQAQQPDQQDQGQGQGDGEDAGEPPTPQEAGIEGQEGGGG